MIGFFIFDETPTLDKSLVWAHAKLSPDVKCCFYVRRDDCRDISGSGSEFFGVVDDASGIGACLFVKDIEKEADTSLLQNNLHVKGNVQVDRNETIKGTLDANQIKGNVQNGTLTLTSEQTAGIVTAGTSGAPFVLSHLTMRFD